MIRRIHIILFTKKPALREAGFFIILFLQGFHHKNDIPVMQVHYRVSPLPI